MTDQREKRIEEIREKVEPGTIIPVPFGMEESGKWIGYVTFLLTEVSRLQVERDKAIGVLQGYALMGLEGARNVLSELGVPHDPLD